ncbi:MAG: ATP-binding protein [Promethearchaeota archaeon]|nr:MAG: ATP-binding protein [Candidatus Lokiarchaeota archaeon]
MVGNLKFNVRNREIINSAIILHKGSKDKGVSKAISILEIANIPNNIRVRENRLLMKNVEKIFTDNSQQYLHYHLTAMMNYLKDTRFSYEISLNNNRIHFRLLISMKDKNKTELLEKLKTEVEIIEEIYKTSFPGLKFSLLTDVKLDNAWGDIIGGIGNYHVQVIDDDILQINQGKKKLFIQVVKLIDKPQIKAQNAKTQIDNLIMSLISSKITNGSFIINVKPIEIYKFGEEDKFNDSNKNLNFINDSYSNIRESLLKIRHVEMTGLWKVSAYFVLRSQDKDRIKVNSKKLVAILDSIFSGNKFSVETKLVKKKKLLYFLPKFLGRNNLNNNVVISSERLSTYFHIPEEPFPSISRTTIPTFELPPEDLVNEKLEIGTVLYQDSTELFPIGIDLMDLRLNMFVTGLIGMGKTTFVKNILKKISKFYPKINWIVLDWKGDYVDLIKNSSNTPILVLRPGTDEAPFHINMFNPYKGDGEEHAQKLFSLMIELFKSDFNNKPELSVQMERVCREVIREVVCNSKKRSLRSFFKELELYGKQHASSNRTILMTINALINRFDRFRSGNLKKVFDVDKNLLDFDVLMKEKVVFDFNYLLSNGGTKEDVRFLMNLILKYIIDFALKRGLTNELKHLVIVEDAQLLLPAVLREVAETNLGEDIPLLLRGVGQAMISVATRPEISPDVISNSGIKVSFRSTYDSKKIANYQNLNKEQEEYLKILPEREAIITIPSFQYPFRINSTYTRPFSIVDKEIYNNNKRNFSFLYKNLEQMDEKLINNDNREISCAIKEKQIDSISARDLKKVSQIENGNPREKEKTSDAELDSIKKLYEKFKPLLKDNPLDKYQIGENLQIPISQLEKEIDKLIESHHIYEIVLPVFGSNSLKKVYALNNDINFLLKHVEQKIEKDFIFPGTFGHLSNKHIFDYIWYSENIYIKLFIKDYNILDQEGFGKEVTDWITEMSEKGITKAIIITGFIKHKYKINNWLKNWELQGFEVFCYQKEDWTKLREMIRDENPDILFENIQVNKKISNQRIKSNKNENTAIISRKDDNYNREIISEIKKDFGDTYPNILLEQFNFKFPSTEEVADYIGCAITEVESELKPIKKYLKSKKIREFDSPNSYKIHYGWSNKKIGRQVLKRNIIDQLIINNISFKTDVDLFEKHLDFEIYLPNHSTVVNIIFEEKEINSLKNTLMQQLNNLQNTKIVIIAYNIELKDKLEKLLKVWNLTNKIKIILYDWSEIKPWIRRITK